MRTFNGKTYEEGQKHDMQELLEIISILRCPQGCPWDREQTHETLKKCLTDETEEVLQAINAARSEMPVPWYTAHGNCGSMCNASVR